jgi:hypothetical protein
VLNRINGISVAVADRVAAARSWLDLLGAVPESDDEVPQWGAFRTRLRLGTGRVDLLQPNGDGTLKAALDAHGPHLFAAGATDPDATEVRFMDPADAGGHGLRVVVSPEEGLPAVGAITELYEVTNLVADADVAAKAYADVFGLDATAFVPIESTQYGYKGSLTLFDASHERLHRFEVIHPYDGAKTMGRYFDKHGDSLYMCFAEAPDIAAVADRASVLNLPVTVVSDHTVFIHPQALGGCMVGLSRPGYAWTWSGHPERVNPPAAPTSAPPQSTPPQSTPELSEPTA